MSYIFLTLIYEFKNNYINDVINKTLIINLCKEIIIFYIFNTIFIKNKPLFIIEM